MHMVYLAFGGRSGGVGGNTICCQERCTQGNTKTSFKHDCDLLAPWSSTEEKPLTAFMIPSVSSGRWHHCCSEGDQSVFWQRQCQCSDRDNADGLCLGPHAWIQSTLGNMLLKGLHIITLSIFLNLSFKINDISTKITVIFCM